MHVSDVSVVSASGPTNLSRKRDPEYAFMQLHLPEQVV
jgi:hypothetical protein